MSFNVYVTELDFFFQVVLHRSQTTLPVITVPRIYQQENSKKKKAEEKATLAKRLEKIRKESRKGKKDVSICCLLGVYGM